MEVVRQAIEPANLEVRNPFNNDLVGVVRCDTRSSVSEAISRAERYNFSLSGWDRYQILARLCSLLESSRDEFRRLISVESG